MTTAQTPPGRFFTAEQVAEALGVNQCKVLGWLHSGQLRGINVAASAGGRPRWRIRLADLEKFLAARAAPRPMPTQRRRKHRDSQLIEFF